MLRAAAEAALRAATRADAAFAEARYNLADLLDNQGRSEAAIECLPKALVVAPDYIDAMFNLALFCCEKGHMPKPLIIGDGIWRTTVPPNGRCELGGR